jgi:transposase
MSRLSYAAPISLTDDERTELELMVCRKGVERRYFLRASAILMSDDDVSPTEVANILNVTSGMVRRWRRVFTRERLPGLFKPRRPHAPRKYEPEVRDAILTIAAQPPPQGKRWWTVKLIASQLEGVNHHYVWNVIRNFGIDLRAGRRRTYRY